MLISILRKVSKLLLAYLLFANSVYAFDSSSAYNVVTMSYPSNQMIYNRVVLDATQKAQSSVTFSVDVKNGGGRPTHDLNGVPQTYSTQTDSAYIRMRMYDQAGTLINTTTSQTYTLRNYGTNPGGWSAAPGDNLQPWSNASVTYTGNLTNVRFIQIEMVGTDGAYWAGNYGPQWRAPTVTFGSDTTNTVYNPEFGIAPNSVKAQGWFNSSNNWATCGTTSGSIPCVTAESGVTANMWGGGYDVNGGSLAGAVGGYDGTLSTTSADTAAATGDPSSGGSTPATPTPVYSSSITSAQQSRKTANLNGLLGHDANVTINGDSNDIYIQQANGRHYIDVNVSGNSNSATVLQTGQGYTGVQHYLEVGIIGSNNSVDIAQRDTNKTAFVKVNGNYNTVGVNQKGTGNHYLDLSVAGSNHSAAVVQDGSGSHNATVLLDGNQPWTFQLNQNGSTGQTYSLPHTMSDNSAVSGTCSATGGCNLTVNQQ